jgi:hypothetical protein
MSTASNYSYFGAGWKGSEMTTGQKIYRKYLVKNYHIVLSSTDEKIYGLDCVRRIPYLGVERG